MPFTATQFDAYSGRRPIDWSGGVMIGLGIILLILGYVLKVAVLQTIGVVLLVIGAVLWVLGSVGRPVGGRRYWY
jgi:drug/metabolite transporter (DMT)-like permease